MLSRSLLTQYEKHGTFFADVVLTVRIRRSAVGQGAWPSWSGLYPQRSVPTGRMPSDVGVVLGAFRRDD